MTTDVKVQFNSSTLKASYDAGEDKIQISNPYGNDCCCFLDPSTPDWVISTAYSVQNLVEHDTKTYRCIQLHTSTADDEPSVGANWANYWSAASTAQACGNTNWDICSGYGGIGKTPKYLTVTFSGIIHTGDTCDLWPPSPNTNPNRQFVLKQNSIISCEYNCGPFFKIGSDCSDWDPDRWAVKLVLNSGNVRLYHEGGGEGCCIAFWGPRNWVLGQTYEIYGSPTWCGEGVWHNNVQYECKQVHTAAAANEPGVGVNWAAYWSVFTSRSCACDIIKNTILNSRFYSGDCGNAVCGTMYIECGGPTYSDWEIDHLYSVGDMVVGSDGSIYVCDVEHTSSTSDRPSTGANWDDYWDCPLQECL